MLLNQKDQQKLVTLLGTHILIVGDHPHTGEMGVIDRVEKTQLGDWGFVVKSGDKEFFIFDGKNMKILNNEKNTPSNKMAIIDVSEDMWS